MANIIVDGKSFKAKNGTRLVNALEDNGYDILHRCGGNAKCTTCKVTFTRGEPSKMNDAEKAKLEEKGDLGDYRLSCQLTCYGRMEVDVLMTVTNSGLDDAGGRVPDEL